MHLQISTRIHMQAAVASFNHGFLSDRQLAVQFEVFNRAVMRGKIRHIAGGNSIVGVRRG